MNPWLQIILAVEPAIPGLIEDIRVLVKKHPALADPTAQAALIAAIGQAAADVDDATVAKWSANR